MEVLLEPCDGRIKATSGGPLDLTADGETEEEALANLRAAALQRVKNGARLIEMPIADKFADPLLSLAGVFKDDPTFDEWQQAIQENRRRADAQEGPW